MVQIDVNGRDDQARAVAQQPDGKLVVVGTTLSRAGDFDIAADPPSTPSSSGSSADPAPAKGGGGGSIDWLLIGALAAAARRRH